MSIFCSLCVLCVHTEGSPGGLCLPGGGVCAALPTEEQGLAHREAALQFWPSRLSSQCKGSTVTRMMIIMIIVTITIIRIRIRIIVI